MPTKHLLIKGTVQGVFFRASAKAEAEKLQLAGWVKNTKEGHVESIVTGSAESLQAYVAWCQRGPSGAVVTAVEVKDLPEQPFGEFAIHRS